MILQGSTRSLSEARPVFVIEMLNKNAAPVDPSAQPTRVNNVWQVLAIRDENVECIAGR